MKIPKSAVVVGFTIFTVAIFGIGLTWPLWLVLAGRGPLEAIRSGTPIVVLTITGLVITIVIAVALQSVRKPMKADVETDRTQR